LSKLALDKRLQPLGLAVAAVHLVGVVVQRQGRVRVPKLRLDVNRVLARLALSDMTADGGRLPHALRSLEGWNVSDSCPLWEIAALLADAGLEVMVSATTKPCPPWSIARTVAFAPPTRSVPASRPSSRTRRGER
jgi:hypothetical protein